MWGGWGGTHFSQPVGLSGLSSQAAQPLLLLLHQTPESQKHTNTQSAGDQLEKLAGSTANLLELLPENCNLLIFKVDSTNAGHNSSRTGRCTNISPFHLAAAGRQGEISWSSFQDQERTSKLLSQHQHEVVKVV